MKRSLSCACVIYISSCADNTLTCAFVLRLCDLNFDRSCFACADNTLT